MTDSPKADRPRSAETARAQEIRARWIDEDDRKLDWSLHGSAERGEQAVKDIVFILDQLRAAQEDRDQHLERANQEIAALPVAAPIRAEGQRVREEWNVTVTDIWMLARVHPGCVKIEPRLSEIKELLDAGVKVAGILAKKEIKAGVTGAGRGMRAIEV